MLLMYICLAGMTKEIIYEGYVVSVNGEQITLLVEDKNITVNQKDIPSYYKIMPGHKVIAIIKKPERKKVNKRVLVFNLKF